MRGRRRTKVALAFSIAMLAAFVALGGIGLAASSVTGKGPDRTSAGSQYQFPAWVCLRKEKPDKHDGDEHNDKLGSGNGYHGGTVKYKLFYAPSPDAFGGWELIVYYGANPGPCPPGSL